jgi:hypothetical protein
MQVGTKSAQLSFETARKRTREIGLTPDIRTFEKRNPPPIQARPLHPRHSAGSIRLLENSKVATEIPHNGSYFHKFSYITV